MWPFNLSVRLPIVDLVGRYPANYLIGREPIFQRIAPLATVLCSTVVSCGISVRFQTLSPSERQVAHALLTRPPLRYTRISKASSIHSARISVRLACVRHAASVRPEPGSNSLKMVSKHLTMLKSFLKLSQALNVSDVRHRFSQVLFLFLLRLTLRIHGSFFLLVV